MGRKARASIRRKVKTRKNVIRAVVPIAAMEKTRKMMLNKKARRRKPNLRPKPPRSHQARKSKVKPSLWTTVQRKEKEAWSTTLATKRQTASRLMKTRKVRRNRRERS